MNIDYFPVPSKDTVYGCFMCGSDSIDKEQREKILPSKILEIESLEWIPKNNNPVG